MDFSSILTPLNKSAETITSAIGKLQSLPNVPGLQLPGELTAPLQQLQNSTAMLQGAQQKMEALAQTFQNLPAESQSMVMQTLNSSNLTGDIQNVTSMLESKLPNPESMASQFNDAFSAAQAKASDAVGQIQGKATEAFSAAQQKATGALGQIQSKATEAFGTVQDKMSGAVSQLQSQAGSTLNNIQGQANQALNAAQGQLNDAVGQIKSTADQAYSAADRKSVV